MILQVLPTGLLDTRLRSSSSEEAELKSPVLVEDANYRVTNNISSALPVSSYSIWSPGPTKSS